MSVANYGSAFRSQVVSNALAADIIIPVVGDGVAQTMTPLIQTDGGVEIPLVLGEGTWAVQARAAQNVENGAATYQYIQCRLVNVAGGGDIADCPAITGSAIVNGANQEVYHQCAGFVTIAPGATLTLALRCYVTGNSLQLRFTSPYANITATKISV